VIDAIAPSQLAGGIGIEHARYRGTDDQVRAERLPMS